MNHPLSPGTSSPFEDASPDPAAEGPCETTETRGGHAATALPLEDELYRKGLHLLALAIPAGMYALGRTWALSLLVPLTIVAVGADVARARSPRFSQMILSIFGWMMRPRERSSLEGRTVLNGATWVLLAATLLTALFPVDLGAPAFAAFMVADAAAAIVGVGIGRLHWFGTRRTVEGSLAFVIVALLCLLAFTHISAAAAATAAVTGAAVEVPDWRLNDNVVVPVVMAAVLVIFGL